MWTIIMVIVGLVWNRILWPFLLLYVSLMVAGAPDMVAQAIGQGTASLKTFGGIFETITVWVKLLLSTLFWLLPGMWLTWVPIIIVVDLVQIGITLIKGKSGLPAFNWIMKFGFGRRQNGQMGSQMYGQQGVGGLFGRGQQGYNQYGNTGYGMQQGFNQYGQQRGGLFGHNRQGMMNGQYGNPYGNQYGDQYGNQYGQPMNQNRLMRRQQQKFQYDNNLSETKAAGKRQEKDLWLVQNSNKVYITADGVVQYAYKKSEYTVTGKELYEKNGVKVFAVAIADVTASTGSSEDESGNIKAVEFDKSSDSTLVKKMGSKPIYCELSVFGIDLQGLHYFISNQGEVLQKPLVSYKQYKITDKTVIRDISDDTKVLESNAIDSEGLLVELENNNDVLEKRLPGDKKLDVAATLIEDGAETFVYQFNSKAPYDIVPPDRDVFEDDEEKVVEKAVPHAGTFGGKKAWKVNGLEKAFIIEDGTVVISYNGDKRQYANDEERIVNSIKCYLFIFDGEDKEFEEYIKKQLDPSVLKKCTVDGSLKLLISRYGTLYNPTAENKSSVTNLLDEEEEMERITLKDLKGKLSEGVTNVKVLKMDAQNFKNRIKNRGMVQDGVYNNGAVDMLCQYGELRCYYCEKQLPFIQTVYVARLMPIYAINNILDRISKDWKEDVPASDVQELISNDVESLIGQQETATVNSWIVKGDIAYYMSIVLDMRDIAEARRNILLIKRVIMGAITNVMDIRQSDSICYITNISQADEDKLLSAEDTAFDKQYYRLNYIETIPDIFKKRLAAINQEGVKKLQEEFRSECGVVFKIRHPLVEAYAASNIRYMKFTADDNFLRQIEETNLASLIDLSAKSASITKLCSYLDKNIFGKQSLKNKIKGGWRKDYFIIRTRQGSEFEFNFFAPSQEFYKSETPFSDTINQPLISCAFWTANKHCVLDSEQLDIVLYMFHKSK